MNVFVPNEAKPMSADEIIEAANKVKKAKEPMPAASLYELAKNTMKELDFYFENKKDSKFNYREYLENAAKDFFHNRYYIPMGVVTKIIDDPHPIHIDSHMPSNVYTVVPVYTMLADFVEWLENDGE